MREFISSTKMQINPVVTTVLQVGCSHTLAVEKGCIWVTRSGDAHDYWLRAGETLALTRGERLWVSVEGELPARVSFVRRTGCEERLIRWIATGLRRMVPRLGPLSV